MEIGKYNRLKIVKEVDFGLYLDGEEFGEILLPQRYEPEIYMIGQELEVFIYRDSEDRIIATTETPIATVGEFAYLEVVAVNSAGAFLNWGLPKDILLPFREQAGEVEVGKKCLVRVLLDEKSQRIVASARIDKFLDIEPIELTENEEVDLIIWRKSDLGYVAIINNTWSGVIYSNTVFKPLKRGDKITGYISKLREDGKIDLSLTVKGYTKVWDITDNILEIIAKNGGFMGINDKTAPSVIYELFGVSKKSFKMALGALYKSKKVIFTDGGVKIIESIK